MSHDRVIVKGEDAFEWDFRTGKPSVALDRHGGWRRMVEVDPFPAYPHDPEVAAAELARVEALFPIGAPPYVYLLPREEIGRTNGFEVGEILREGDRREKRLVTAIALFAKRIPIHPAMTRYLVAHEYGHAVEDWLLWKRGKEVHETDVADEYAALRGLESAKAGGGVWHAAIAEVFACDFRILVAKSEVEYWPHPGIERPEGIRAIRDWWAGRLAEDAYRTETAA